MCGQWGWGLKRRQLNRNSDAHYLQRARATSICTGMDIGGGGGIKKIFLWTSLTDNPLVVHSKLLYYFPQPSYYLRDRRRLLLLNAIDSAEIYILDMLKAFYTKS